MLFRNKSTISCLGRCLLLFNYRKMHIMGPIADPDCAGLAPVLDEPVIFGDTENHEEPFIFV